MNIVLDIQGQNPRLSRLYTQLCFCFPLTSTTASKQAVIEQIQFSLERLSHSVPWIAGRVASEGGKYSIVSYKSIPQLSVLDLQDRLPSYAQMRSEGFPFRYLDEKTIASKRTLPASEDDENPAEVLAVRINFVEDGVLLVFDAQHNCMDIRGQCEIIRLLAESCRGETFDQREVEEGNYRNQDEKMLLPRDEKCKHKHEVTTAGASAKEDKKDEETALQPVKWSYINFTSNHLSTLKSSAATSLPRGSSFVSTDDVLSAFLWQSISRARQQRLALKQTTTTTTFERQVNARKHVGIAQTYTGNCVFKVSTTLSIAEVMERSLGCLASRLREEISDVDDIAHRVKLAATEMRGRLAGGKPDSASSRPKPSSFDIKMSSWAKEECYDYDFGGLLGKPEAVRRPAFDAWDGLAYLMPKDREGAIAAAVCLREVDLGKLRKDEEMVKYGTWVG